jgi:sugar O-acyltransferase (sialic acid O-acetyltransferase NeuD family)
MSMRSARRSGISRKRRWALVGAGGHAKALVEAIDDRGETVEVYVDAKTSGWLDLPRLATDEELLDRRLRLLIGFGATGPEGLVTRLAKLRSYIDRGFEAPPLVHRDATVSRGATLGAGTVVLAKAVVQPGAIVGAGVIVNTGAIVEHDARIDDGVHVAPGAIVLGGAHIGECAMIGAGAVVLQFAKVPAGRLVKVNTRWLKTERTKTTS